MLQRAWAVRTQCSGEGSSGHTGDGTSLAGGSGTSSARGSPETAVKQKGTMKADPICNVGAGTRVPPGQA